MGRVPAGCAANPQTTFESSRTINAVSSRVRVLVVGGGIAGMHAARMLKMQGHDVTLHELQTRSAVRSATAAESSLIMALSPIG